MGLCLVLTSMIVDQGFTVWLSNFLGSLLVWTTVWDRVKSLTIVRVGTEGIVILGLIGLSALISYNIAALIYRHARKRLPAKEFAPFIPAPKPELTVAQPSHAPSNLASMHLQS